MIFRRGLRVFGRTFGLVRRLAHQFPPQQENLKELAENGGSPPGVLTSSILCILCLHSVSSVVRFGLPLGVAARLVQYMGHRLPPDRSRRDA